MQPGANEASAVRHRFSSNECLYPGQAATKFRAQDRYIWPEDRSTALPDQPAGIGLGASHISYRVLGPWAAADSRRESMLFPRNQPNLGVGNRRLVGDVEIDGGFVQDRTPLARRYQLVGHFISPKRFLRLTASLTANAATLAS